MKLRLLMMVVFLLFLVTAANCSPRHCRTLSATTKKPASLAGFLYLGLTFSRRTALFLPATSLSCRRRSFQSTIQTPSSL